MKAIELFEITVYSSENGISEVGDGQERFEIRTEGLSQEISMDERGDALTNAYDLWCLEWAV